MNTNPRRCLSCGKTERETPFYPYRKTKCSACVVADTKAYKLRNIERKRKYEREYNARTKPRRLEQIARWRERIRDETFAAYGGARCSCCGETRREFLCLDHVHGGGNIDRKNRRANGGSSGGVNWYLALRREGYPPGYQVLCFNCNMSLGFRGYCPHELER